MENIFFINSWIQLFGHSIGKKMCSHCVVFFLSWKVKSTLLALPWKGPLAFNYGWSFPFGRFWVLSIKSATVSRLRGVPVILPLIDHQGRRPSDHHDVGLYIQNIMSWHQIRRSSADCWEMEVLTLYSPNVIGWLGAGCLDSMAKNLQSWCFLRLRW